MPHLSSALNPAVWNDIPRFAWRVESTKSRYRISLLPEQGDLNTQYFSKTECRSWISAHMTGEYYDAPCVITSLTGSLLWALNYAHWLLSKGYSDINILLIDIWKIPNLTIYPARSLASYLEVAPRNISWHDNPYHEYFVFGSVPHHAILRPVGLESATGKEINILLPGFCKFYKDEGLHASLERFQIEWSIVLGITADCVSVTEDDIRAADATACKFVSHADRDVHFQIAMMFLSLRKRNWNKEAWLSIRNMFEAICVPSVYLYKSWMTEIDHGMPDVIEWVIGMEHIRRECIMANALSKLYRH